MLEKFKTQASLHLQAAAESFRLLLQHPFSTLMTIWVIAVALALPTLFAVFIDNATQLTSRGQGAAVISLYLKPDFDESNVAPFLAKLEAVEGVAKLRFKSRAEGLTELLSQEGMEGLMRYLPANPLPPVVEVFPGPQVDSPKKLKALSLALGRFSSVEIAKIDLEWINRVHAVLAFLNTLAQTLMALLFFAVLLIIGNTLRLAMQSRQEEISILKWVGASDAYIARPILYAGIYYGFFAAVVALFLVSVFMLTISQALHELTRVYQISYSITLIPIRRLLMLFTFAIILGWLGALLSVRSKLLLADP